VETSARTASLIFVEGPFRPLEIEHEKSFIATYDNVRDPNAPVAVGVECVVRRAAVSGFISDLGIFCQNMRSPLSDGDKRSLEHSIGFLFVAALEEIQNIQAERSDAVEGCGILPPVLHFELSELLPRDFVQIVQNQRQRLLFTWEDQKIEDLGDEFRSFKNALHSPRRANFPDCTARRGHKWIC
jgi:hypothetical protein